jgi:hypothetical protein
VQALLLQPLPQQLTAPLLPRSYWVGVIKPPTNKHYRRTDRRPLQNKMPSTNATDYAKWRAARACASPCPALKSPHVL